ncbi:MAG: ribosome biogenesis GTPase Der [Spongiibacteraceae bacterium]|jgi:GTP-binding protein|nr:ribosome biogenesis GTPase Der [Spongiibacteraceae bacterium]
MVPVIALVGRPNVGKSTLFNRMTRTQDALVANFPGLTRDRQYGEATHAGRRMILIDTAGITGEEIGIDAAMAQQSLQAVQEADAVLFMLDARAGLTGADMELARSLRQRNKPIFVVANKIDGADPDAVMAELFELGADRIYPITATHGRGVKSLFDAVLGVFPAAEAPLTEEQEAEETAERGIRLAIVGRPNVGKSTLVNRMLGEERVVVFDMPGTTRDSVYIPYEREGRRYTIIDTAGVRRRRNVSEVVEKFSIVKTLKAISDANVVILVLDASEGLVEQDLHLLGHVIEAGRAVVVAVNKWDGLDADHKQNLKIDLERRLQFVDYAEVHFISALHGTGVGHLYQSVHAAYAAATQKLQTPRLTRILEDALLAHAPPMVNGRRIKLRYAHSGGMNPPLIVIHGNQTERVPVSYQRYLENVFRRELKLVGTPVRIEFRTSENPYAGKRNPLSQRQVQRKRRLMKHVKKSRKK